MFHRGLSFRPLQKKHQDGLEKLRILLESATGVSLTTNMWTSRAMEGYITMTVHFIAEDQTQRSLVLATAGFVQQAMSTSSERVLSAGGLVANQQTATLSPANVDAIVFLNKNRMHLFGPVPVAAAAEPVQVKNELAVEEDEDAASDLPDLPLHDWEEL